MDSKDDIPKPNVLFHQQSLLKKPILIQGAMPIEIDYFIEQLGNVYLEKVGDFNFWIGSYNDYPMIISETKKGIANAASATTIAALKYSPVAIINQGTAGGVELSGQKFGDIVVGKESVYMGSYFADYQPLGEGICMEKWLPTDLNASCRSARYDCNKTSRFQADSLLLESAKSSIDSFKAEFQSQHPRIKIDEGSIGSMDIFCNHHDLKVFFKKTFNVIAEDMETSSSAQISQFFKIPFLGIRILSDEPSVNEYFPQVSQLNQKFVLHYDEVKFGIFIHWGVYSVPAFGANGGGGAEWYWYFLENPSQDGGQTLAYHNKAFGPKFTYQSFAPMFNCRLFDPDQWARTIESSGAKYVVLTSKHHEGFTLWDSPQSWGWNSVNIGPGLDLVGALSKSIKSLPGIHMGLYHSLFEWYNPIYLNDKNTGSPPKTSDYVNDVLMPQLKDIVNLYEPHVIWSDGDWEQLSTYWQSTEFLAWLYTNSSVKDVVVTNDRWGSECRNTNGGYWSGGDKWNPGYLVPHKWENCNTIGLSWGYAEDENLAYYQNTTYLVQELVSTVSCGGNFLLDIGPTAEGTIPAIMQLRLEEMGEWMAINGECIYNTTPWRAQNDSSSQRIWYTTNKSTGAVYAIVFDWPEAGALKLNIPIASASSQVQLLGYRGKAPVVLSPTTTAGSPGVTLTLPFVAPQDYPPFGVYTFKLLNVS
eukprot:gene997-1266_t